MITKIEVGETDEPYFIALNSLVNALLKRGALMGRIQSSLRDSTCVPFPTRHSAALHAGLFSVVPSALLRCVWVHRQPFVLFNNHTVRALVLTAGLLLFSPPSGAQERRSGITGAVHVCCHPGATPLNWHAHYNGKLEFKRSSDGQLAATATVDAKDTFVVYLPPGRYFLAQPPKPGPKSYVDLIIPGQRPKRSSSITVEVGKLTSVNVDIDNGMR